MSESGFFRQPDRARGDNGSMTDEERLARLVLHYGKVRDRARFARDCRSGGVTAGAVLAEPSMGALYGVEVTARALERAHEDWRLARFLGIAVLAHGDPTWFLHQVTGFRPPGILFALGRPEDDLLQAGGTTPDGAVNGRRKIICIVGSRAASRWAVDLTRSCAAALAGEGAVIVSGGALGVDAAAHEGALEAAGRTWVFLGSGLLAPYPARNRGLFERVAASGNCLFSANHLYGTPDRAFFVQRNAFMAACADVTVVMEASSVSGALHTARFALRQGKAVLAHPGSAGCNRILLEGARPFRDLPELVSALEKPARAGEGARDEKERSLQNGLFPEEIAAKTGNTLTEVFQQLQIGELNGEVVRLPGGRYLFLRYVE